MTNLHVLTGAGESPAYPIVRKIGFADLKDAVAKGIDDFWAAPTHVIFLAIIYPIAVTAVSNNPGVGAYIGFLKSSEARSAFENQGFVVLP